MSYNLKAKEQTMNHTEQRQLAIKLFGHLDPGLSSIITDEDNCFKDIFKHLLKYRNEVLGIIKDIEIPSEWAYWWAYHIGDHDIMIDKVTDTQWGRWWNYMSAFVIL
jgi:hypothetical protein